MTDDDHHVTVAPSAGLSDDSPDEAEHLEAGDLPDTAETLDAEPGRDGRRSPSPRAIALTLAVAALTAVAVLAVLLAIWLSRDVAEEVDTNGIQVEHVITGPGKGEFPRFSRPSGVAFGPAGEIYVADTGNNRVVVFDEDGEYLRQFGRLGIAKPLPGAARTWEPGLLSYPIDVAVDATGTVYVADFYNDSISVFGSDGSFRRRFPDPYKQVGKGSSGQDGGGIAVTALATIGGRVYATDTYQVFVFSADGRVVRQFGRPGSDAEGLDHPNGIAVDAAGRIYVADSNNNRVKAYGPDGRLLWTRGGRISDLRKKGEEPVVLPRGMAVERDGSLLLADTLGQQLVRLGQDGRIAASFGSRGDAPGQIDFPNDVAVRGDRVIVADRANDRVQVVRLEGR